MKIYKRIISAVLVFLLIIPISVSMAFSDVPKDAWYAGDVSALENGGLFIGYSDGLFHPDDNIYNGSFITVIARCVGREYGADSTGYWCGETVLQAKKAGWLPPHWEALPVNPAYYERAITREEAIYILMTALEPKDRNLGYTTNDIKDFSDISLALRDTILNAYNAGITKGVDGGCFMPKENLTRAQTAAILNRAGYRTAASIEPSKITVTTKCVNSWVSGGDAFYQYSIAIKNSGGNISDWSLTLSAPNASISQFWNCKAEASAGKILVTPADYNAAIPSGKEISDIGIIVSGGEISPETLTAQLQSGGSVNVDCNSNSSAEVNPKPPAEVIVPEDTAEALSVFGTHLINKHGQTVQLRGVSTHGLAWYPQYVNEDTFRTLRDDWGANTIRLAMYTAEYGGYCSGGDKNELKSLIDKGVTAASKLGMYVIIDWHVLSDGNPMTHKAEAIDFFQEMSKKYADFDNVIYEICNEPQSSPWNSVIKPYAEDVIDAIRKNDNDAIIIVGTNTWSQDVNEVIGNMLSDKNVMYAFHFYAATHKDDMRQKLEKAIKAGIPVFVSECGISEASGQGNVDISSANSWLKLLNDNSISFISWGLSNKAETVSLIKSGCNKLSGWTTSDLTESGNWFKNAISSRN